MKSYWEYFEIVNFATPETNVRLRKDVKVPKTDEIIIAKCMNWQDVMHLYAADSILVRNDIYVKWYIPYKPFARQDRVTDTTHANESDIMLSIFGQSERFIFLDVHSNKCSFGHNIAQFTPIEKYTPFGKHYMESMGWRWTGEYHIVCPDAGAIDKIPSSYDGNVIHCTKERNPQTGELSNFIVPEFTPKRKYNIVLIDDICDGGGTFIGIGKHLQKYRPKNKVILYVTHGLFTKGVVELLKYFDEIYTTNSVFVQNTQNTQVKVLDVLSDEFMNYAISKD